MDWNLMCTGMQQFQRDKIVETLSSNGVTSIRRINQSTPLPHPFFSKFGCLLFPASTFSLNRSVTLHGVGGGGTASFSPFEVGKTSERPLGQSVSTNFVANWGLWKRFKVHMGGDFCHLPASLLGKYLNGKRKEQHNEGTRAHQGCAPMVFWCTFILPSGYNSYQLLFFPTLTYGQTRDLSKHLWKE